MSTISIQVHRQIAEVHLHKTAVELKLLNNQVEVLSANVIEVLRDVQHVVGESPLGAINGSNATFTTQYQFIPESLEVFINGLLQRYGSNGDYLNTNSTTIQFSTSPTAGDVITINYTRA